MVTPLHGVERATVPRLAGGFKGSRRIGAVKLRICMVTPFAWSQPHPVNDHVAGAAAELRRRGHEVVVLAPSSGRPTSAPGAGR